MSANKRKYENLFNSSGVIKSRSNEDALAKKADEFGFLQRKPFRVKHTKLISDLEDALRYGSRLGQSPQHVEGIIYKNQRKDPPVVFAYVKDTEWYSHDKPIARYIKIRGHWYKSKPTIQPY
ncbi:MAG TPA: hypothetical protein VFF13_05025 [archaeon]|nr:hypothetical protein [archaeon]